jgi:hypothetical protein
MNKLHLAALVVFVLAVVSYLMSWVAAAVVLALVGLFVDALAWFAMLGSRRDNKPD